jgi:ubiquinone/menaquinone biosynthesis C-methylase UbiE
MMNDHFRRVSAAFSRKAAEYDAFGVAHPQLTRMRRQVYDHISALAVPGARFLELNAGTGADAVALVERGYSVHATDISPAMISAVEAKIETGGLSHQLRASCCSFTDLSAIDDGPFDLIFSNSGGLNCISDLSVVTAQLPRLLHRGGLVTWVIMPRICPWELARLGKDWRVALRRLRPGGVQAHVSGITFQTHYFSAQAVRDSFGPAFVQVKLEALALLTPPADNKDFAHRHPRLYQILVGIEESLAFWPILRGWGDFFILSMRYVG